MSEYSGPASAATKAKETPAPNLESIAIVRQLAHELRQPLSTIESIAYYLDIVVPRQDDRVRQQVDKLRQVAQQASWILSDAVHFVQASPPSPQVLDLNELVIDAIRESTGGGQSWLEESLCDSAPLIRIDVEQARHMLRNGLLLFRRLSGATIALSTVLSPPDVILTISARDVDFTSDEARPALSSFSYDVSTGFGLGLASIRRIVEAHNGRIELKLAPEKQLSLRIVVPAAD